MAGKEEDEEVSGRGVEEERTEGGAQLKGTNGEEKRGRETYPMTSRSLSLPLAGPASQSRALLIKAPKRSTF